MPQPRQPAGRHKGSRKVRVYADPEPVDRLAVPSTNPRDAIRYWREQLHHPLPFVYFIQDERGPVKIGRAYDPLSRMSELQCGNPFKLTLRAAILTASETAEERIHEMWRTAQIRGEWFGGGVENDIIARARRTQREQIEAMTDNSACFADVLELPFRIMSQTGMQRG